ncbi:MAG: helix-turn-helix domain-containing protein [Acidobacteria bacterium]|nr:helix-turn-helix domain-containing protein [Acidobacteriota bacterium]
MVKKTGKLMSVKDAAAALDLSEPRIKQMIYRDELKAEKVGNQWIISEFDLSDVKNRRGVGRPSNNETGKK